jgi:hypothetical protein
MPVTRASKSLNKTKEKGYAKEVQFVEKRGRTGRVSFIPLEVQTTITLPSSASSSPSKSRQSTHAPESDMMVIDADPLLDPDVGSAKKSRKSNKVFPYFCSPLQSHSPLCRYILHHSHPGSVFASSS